MTMMETIEARLADELTLSHLEVVNESSNHNVPPGSESHFKVTAVADEFEGLRLLARHRLVNQILVEELKLIHALALHTYTSSDWQVVHADVPMSPPCLGGGR